MHEITEPYDTHSDTTIPLTLISQSHWKKIFREAFSAIEQRHFEHQRFHADIGDICLLYDIEGNITHAYLGTASGDSQEQSVALSHAALHLPAGVYLPVETPSNALLAAWGAARYQFRAYKTTALSGKGDAKAKLRVGEADLPQLRADLQAIFRVRDLINLPPNDLNPVTLAEIVKNIAHEHQATFEEIVGDDLLDANFPAIHAVGRASAYPPRLLSLTWGQENHPAITLIGKGVCFDSGGLDLKPSSAMRLMKKDMGGAAHVIALAEWIMTTQIPLRLRVLIPAVENVIGPNAFRPGDVLTMRNGLTVEIDNTDAEGRLVLADAMVRACEDSPELIVDFSTLTGAARIAVGTELAAMFSNQDSLAQAISHSGDEVNDPVWRLPLFKSYKRLLHSTIADIANGSSAPYAGAITAALFLEQFIEDSTPWVHFDVMAWNLTSRPGKPEGGEAMGLRAVADFLRKTYG
ncbi:MAG: leucyl aminopeptidase family protein [Legionella sp.]|nr:leucyl aminopeptidase family protein [Legionella sp.]